MYNNPLAADPKSGLGKSFRLKFRVTLDIFNVIFKQCDENSLFQDQNIKIRRNKRIPSYIKIMAFLEYLRQDLEF